MTDEDIIELLGGTAAVARRVKAAPASVSEWRRNGIPEGRKIELGAEIESRSAGRWTRWNFRPNDWHLIWPELVGAEGAPEVRALEGEARDAA